MNTLFETPPAAPSRTPRPAPRRRYLYPAAPLVELFRRRFPLRDGEHSDVGYDDVAAARSLGIDVRTWRVWAEIGLTDDRADMAAIALGLHPCQFWPDWDDETIHGDEMLAADQPSLLVAS